MRFLRAAVNPYDEGQGSYRIRELIDKPLEAAALSGTSKVIASRSPEFSQEEMTTLLSFLTSGGGVLLFLDGDHDRANLARLAEQVPNELPLTLNTRLTSENLPGGALKVARGDFSSPFLRLFEGERRRNLAFLEFYHLYHATPTGRGRILLSYADGTPAMAQAQIGLGTLLLCNFSVSELSSNLARQKLFPGWIHDILANLSPADAAELDYLAGDEITTDAWASEVLGRAIIGPEGQEISTRSNLRGERVFLSFEADEPGIYRLPGQGRRLLEAFAVNPSSRESDLRTLETTVLPSRVAGSGQGALVGQGESYRELHRGYPAFQWFILAAVLLLFIESLLHGFLTPPSKPAPTLKA
jgi:hypothetical protein